MSEEEKKAIDFINNIEYKEITSDEFYNNRDILLNLIEKQREEKEREKQYSDFYKNLCDKQQKELENNKKFKKDIVNLIMLWDEEDLPENDRVIECLDTIMSEVSRLEDIEDRKIQVAVEFVEEKRDKYWKDKIQGKIKEKQDKIDKLHPASDMVIIDDLENQIDCYKDLLKENNNEK